MPNPTDNPSMTKENSKFHSQWLKIKKDYDKGGVKHEGVDAEYNKFAMSKNMKGKETLSDKIAGANVSEWKDHKYTPAAFFMNFSKIFEIPEEVDRTYGGLLDKAEVSKKTTEYTEDHPEYVKLEKHEKEHLNTYGVKLQERYLSFGLTGGEVEKRKERYGPNTMPEKKKHHWIFDLIHELTSVFALLLWVGGILAVIGYGLNTEDTSNLWLGIVLWIVVLITGIFAFWQNSKSDDIIESFKSFQNAKAMVVRHGEKVEVNVKDLVLGDVVTFKTGDKVPADIRVFEANALSVNNSGLTGESEPVKLTGQCGEKGFETPLEAKNIAFFSTLCVSGTGKGVIIRTGKETYMGKIADLSQTAETQALTLELEINRFIKIICIIAISLGVGFFFGSIGIGFPLIASFAFAIGIIVANVPEGLLSCLTVTLALTAYKLYKKNVMVKNMGSIETLGAVTCICSDKTGTLTQNRMSVVHLWYDCELKKTFEDQQDIVVDSHEIKLRLFDQDEPTFKTLQFSAVCGSVSDFKKETPDDYPPLVQARNAWVSANKGVSDNQITEKVLELKKTFQTDYDKFYKSNIDDRPTDGDASEAGIIKFFEKVYPIENTRKQYPQHRVKGEDIKIPFSSKTKCAGALRAVSNENDTSDANFLLAFKGAPDYLIKFCTHYMLNGKEYPKDNFFENKFQEANQAFALKGERVLAIAYYRFNKKDYPSDFEFKNDIGNGTEENKVPNYPTTKLCFVGLIAMEDPPREGVKEAITLCKRAGIKVIMVTGDQTLTAASIAYQIGIIEDLDDTPEVIQAKEGLATLEDAEKKSNTIIIDGTRLQKALKADEALSDDNPNKGAFLRNWIMKRDCVFARTSPDQKLIIVDACQKLSHVVAVTGDGVNDSPAIKKANIGIAMGKVGTDVAKDAADILLMDDNFANIIKGIKQGRVIFDTLKKIISYNLSSNIPELMPVIAFFILQFPIPLTTILILTIDVGSDIYPNVAFAYEGAESSIMDRPPRNAKTDNLCTLKLFAWSYLHMGIIEMSGPMLAYFVVMNDYGITPTGLMKTASRKGIQPLEEDIFNQYDPYHGNTRAFYYENREHLGFNEPHLFEVKENESYHEFEDMLRTFDFITNEDGLFDFRVFLYDKSLDSYTTCAFPGDSYKGDASNCYTVEAVRHAQAAYLVNTIVIQVSNGFSYRTITVSIFEHCFKNWDLNFAYIIENAVMIILVYVPGLNYAFAVRPLIVQHWTPTLGAFIIIFLYSEFTKYMMRNQNNPDGSPGFFYRMYRY